MLHWFHYRLNVCVLYFIFAALQRTQNVCMSEIAVFKVTGWFMLDHPSSKLHKAGYVAYIWCQNFCLDLPSDNQGFDNRLVSLYYKPVFVILL